MVKYVAAGIAIGAVLSIGADVLWDGPAAWLVPLLVIAPWLVYCKVWVRRRHPQRVLAYARKHVDPTAGPPPGATPVELWLAKRMDEIGDDDPELYRALHTEDCLFYGPGRKRPRSLEMSMRIHQARRGWLGESKSAYVATLADPHEPDGFWLLGELEVTPPRGEPFELKWVEAWTLTPSRDRIRRRATIAITDVAVATRST
jgi:hypothetical protein